MPLSLVAKRSAVKRESDDSTGAYAGVVALSLAGKFGVSASYMIVYLQVSELFPTGMRSSAVGLASVAGNLASVVVPHIVALVSLIPSFK